MSLASYEPHRRASLAERSAVRIPSTRYGPEGLPALFNDPPGLLKPWLLMTELLRTIINSAPAGQSESISRS